MEKKYVICMPMHTIHLCWVTLDVSNSVQLYRLYVARQAPLFMEFSRQEYWSGLPCPPPQYLPNPRIEPVPLVSPTLAGRIFTTSASWVALRAHIDTCNNTWQSHTLLLLFSCSSASSENSGLISVRIDWFDLFVVQGTLKSLQHCNSEHKFFGAQPSLWSNSYITTWLLERP